MPPKAQNPKISTQKQQKKRVMRIKEYCMYSIQLHVPVLLYARRHTIEGSFMFIFTFGTPFKKAQMEHHFCAGLLAVQVAKLEPREPF